MNTQQPPLDGWSGPEALVYLEYGRAMHAAQVFEESLAVFTNMLNRTGIRGSNAKADDLNWLCSKPMQRHLRLLDDMGVKFHVGALQLRELFETAKEYRDYLAHRALVYAGDLNQPEIAQRVRAEFTTIREYCRGVVLLIVGPLMMHSWADSEPDADAPQEGWPKGAYVQTLIDKARPVPNLKRLRKPRIRPLPTDVRTELAKLGFHGYD